MRFIGELYKAGILLSPFLHHLVSVLFNLIEGRRPRAASQMTKEAWRLYEEPIHSLILLLTIVGETWEKREARRQGECRVPAYYERFWGLALRRSARIRVENLSDFRESGWIFVHPAGHESWQALPTRRHARRSSRFIPLK